ncbi:hypothetical protein LSTR_LSTR012219 [Laodelphax striatellus]|uniref:Uncharacterized protein n=1 Tax=Laodelphax striatellus TaxID=195883 RepID=A0A482XP94_LAOST|nr:hypothetical protein LSTR_LSTR012219 [Laodelphax striatellus]
MIVSPAYNGNSRMKAKQILPTEEEVDEEEVVPTKIEGVKYMPYFNKPIAIETFAEREKRRLRGYPLPAPIRELQNAVKDLKGCDHPVIPSNLQTKLEKFE